MEVVGCPLCGTPSEQTCWHENGYTGRRCESCALIYLSPRPDEKEMAALYNQDMAGGQSAAGLIKGGYDKILDARLTLRWLRTFAPGPRLLEIGPGGGHVLTTARAAGFVPHAVEINSQQASYLQHQRNIRVFNGSITDDACFPEGGFDVIVHSDVLSHLHDPLKAFSSMRKRLKPNGVMLFETGNAGDLSERWLRWLRRLSFPEHVVLMGRRSVSRLLEQTGFSLLMRQPYPIVPWLTAVRLYHRLRPRGANSEHATDANSAAPKSTLDDAATSLQATDQFCDPQTWSFAARCKGTAIHALRYWVSRPLPSDWPATVWHVARRS